MRNFLTMFCGLLLAATFTVTTRADDELSKRVKEGSPTVIRAKDGTTISIPANVLMVEQWMEFSYKEGYGSPFGVTILSSNVKGGVRLSTPRLKGGSPPIEITASEVEVETALTEVFTMYDSSSSGYVPWIQLADALKKAPHSPRFNLSGRLLALGGYFEAGLVYDRRTKNAWRWVETSWEDVGKKFEQHTEKNISEAEIEKRAAAQQAEVL